MLTLNADLKVLNTEENSQKFQQLSDLDVS